MAHPPISESAAAAAMQLFESTYGTRPEVVASAPGRVNLIGEHLDYNGGPVLPVALERRTAVAAAAAPDWRMVSDAEPVPVARDPDAPMGLGWTDYLAGVVRELRAVGAAPAGARIAVATTLPIGAGLSSSAALTVAGGAALGRLAGTEVGHDTLAAIAFRAEHDQVGVHCGHMDQTIAAHAEPGTALLFDTFTGTQTHVPFDAEFWIIETGVAHRLAGGRLNERRRACEAALARIQQRFPALTHLAQLPVTSLGAALEAVGDAELARRVRHVVTEAERTRSAAAALERHDLAALGALLVRGHESLRDDYESTIPEADLIVSAAVQNGAYGARLTGAGWGGAVVLLAPDGRGPAVVEAVAAEYHAAYGRTPIRWGSRAAGGVTVELAA